MKRVIVLLVIAIIGITTAFGQAAEVKGKWDASIETQQGPMPVTLTFAVEGEKITGTLSSARGDLDVAGTISGSEIKFSGSFDMGGQSIALNFAGKVEGDSMSGTVDFGGMGGGNWSAKRAKPGRM